MARVCTILLVEDNDNDAVLFALGVKSLAVAVTHVSDALQAISHLSSKRPFPDLIVLDPTLPGMTAHQFLQWASRAKPAIRKIPIVIYTGGVMVEDALKSMVRGTFFKPAKLI